VVLYRFLFAPVLLAIAVLFASPSRAPSPPPREPRTTVAKAAAGPEAAAARGAGAKVPGRAASAVASRPAAVR